MSLNVGDLAPDFELASHRGGKVRLSSFSGKKAVLIAFHPLAWTPVCATQMSSYERDSSWLEAHGTHVLSISVDSVPCKIEWAKSLGGISYDLLSDFFPHGSVAERYGVARPDGLSERAIFLVDKRGRIAFARVYDIPTLPDQGEIRKAIEGLEGQ